MAKVKYDVSKIEDLPDRTPAPVGIYRGKIVKAELKQSNNGNAMIEVQWTLTHGADGKKLKEDFADIWDYPILDHDHPFVQNRLKDFINAVAGKKKGELDTDKLVGVSAQLKLKSDTDQDGDYRPRIGKIMPLSKDEDPGEEEDDAEAEEEEAEEDDEEDEVNLDDLNRKELKAFIKDEELDVKVLKTMSDDDLRAAIAEAMAEEDEEAEDDEEEDTEEEDDADDTEEEGDGYDDMSIKDLKAELKERELPTNGAKAALIARLRKDDGDEPF